jgi:DnaJ family protein C protein 13
LFIPWRFPRRFFREQRDHPEARWSLADDFSVVHGDAGAGELVVAGVFLRLFIASPGWVLRKPRDFMVELLEKWAQLVAQTNRNVRLHCSCVKL